MFCIPFRDDEPRIQAIIKVGAPQPRGQNTPGERDDYFSGAVRGEEVRRKIRN